MRRTFSHPTLGLESRISFDPIDSEPVGHCLSHRLGLRAVGITILVSLLLIGFAPISLAEDAKGEAAAAEKKDAAAGALSGPMAALQPFLGSWEIDATWADGSRLRSRNKYEAKLGGSFVFAATWVRDGEGDWYQRYETVFGVEGGELVTWGFTYDGTFTKMEEIEVGEVDGKASMTFRWGSGGLAIRQTVTMIDDDSYTWRVWMRSPGSDEFAQAMDGVWKRIE